MFRDLAGGVSFGEEGEHHIGVGFRNARPRADRRSRPISAGQAVAMKDRFGSFASIGQCPRKGPLYAHLRKDEKGAAAAALGQTPKKLMVSITGPLASSDGTY